MTQTPRMSIEHAEQVWANLPTGRKWTSLQTFEKVLVYHTLAELVTISCHTDADHDWQPTNVGSAQDREYQCTKCGEIEYRDVS